MTNEATPVDQEQKIIGMGNQALLSAVVRQRDRALEGQAKAEAQCEVLTVANQELEALNKHLQAALAATTTTEPQE